MRNEKWKMQIENSGLTFFIFHFSFLILHFSK